LNKKLIYILAPVISAGLIIIDQLTKYMARCDLADGPFRLWDGVFILSLTTNKGAAWGILQGRVDILSIISIVFSILIIIMFIRIPSDKKYNVIRLICIFIFSGAVGNVIDRIFMGGVTDFLYIELIDFPIFNVADCYITFSMVIFIFLLIFKYKDDDLDFLSFKKKKDIVKNETEAEGSDKN